MLTFKPNEEALVANNRSALKPFGSQEVAGQRVIILCKSDSGGIEGYEVEYTDEYGTQYTYFIPTDHLAPAPSRSLVTNEPRWKQVAKEWQQKLWKSKLDGENR